MGIDARIFVDVPQPAVPAKLLQTINGRLLDAFGDEPFMFRDWTGSGCENDAPLVVVDRVREDSDRGEIIATEGRCLVECHVYGRWWGPCCERGDWPTLSAICEWLGRNFPGGTVYYGGDSEGVVFQPFAEIRDCYWDHFATLADRALADLVRRRPP